MGTAQIGPDLRLAWGGLQTFSNMMVKVQAFLPSVASA